MKEREPEMRKLTARVANRRAREAAKVGAAAEPSRRATAAVEEPTQDRREPEVARAGDVKVSVNRASEPPPVPLPPTTGPTGDGAARRPQPQHKSRSQRKK
jgi:preprotein translocase subunit SecF